MSHVDTKFLTRAREPGSPANRKLREWVEASEILVTSTVAWAEFLCEPDQGSELALAAEILAQH